MTGRVTPRRPPTEYVSLRRRRPAMYWMALVLALLMAMSLLVPSILLLTS